MYQQDIPFRLNSYYFQILYRNQVLSHSAGHSLAFPHATWGCAHAYRSRRSPAIGLTVGLLLPAEVMPAHHSRKALTLGSAGYVHCLTFCEKRYVKGLSSFIRAGVGHPKLVEVPWNRRIIAEMLYNVTARRARNPFQSFAKSDLHGIVAIRSFGGLYLHDSTRACLHDRDGYSRAIVVEDLCHADFLTDQTD